MNNGPNFNRRKFASLLEFLFLELQKQSPEVWFQTYVHVVDIAATAFHFQDKRQNCSVILQGAVQTAVQSSKTLTRIARRKQPNQITVHYSTLLHSLQ